MKPVLRGPVTPGGTTTLDDTNRAVAFIGGDSGLPRHLGYHVNPVHPEEITQYLTGLRARGNQLGPVLIEGHGSAGHQSIGLSRTGHGAASLTDAGHEPAGRER